MSTERLERLALSGRWVLLVAVTAAAFFDSTVSARYSFVLFLVAVGYLGSLEALRLRSRAIRRLPIVTAVGDVCVIAGASVVFDGPWLTAGLYALVIAWNGLRHGERGALPVAGGVGAIEACRIWAAPHHPPLLALAGEGLTVLGIALLTGYVGRCRLHDAKRLARLQTLEENHIDRTGTLAHELRTPLAMIKTAADLLLEGRPGPTTVTQRNFLHMISGNVARLIGMSEEMLARVRTDAAWLTMDPRPVDIRPLIRETAAHIRPLIASDSQTLRFDHPQILSPALVDPRWLQQIMINLIYNASKHTPNGGGITVTARENEAWILVSVTDTGSGLPEAERERIFDRFYQCAEPAKSDGTGVGLGLAIVRHIVEKHGGRIYVGTMLERGSTFAFTLPKARKGDEHGLKQAGAV